MQLKNPDYERVFRRDPEYKEYPGMDPKVVEALKKDHVLTLYVPDTARWFVSEHKEKRKINDVKFGNISSKKSVNICPNSSNICVLFYII